MALSQLKFNEVRLSLINGGNHAERAERISRLTFEYVREMMMRELQHLGAGAEIDHLMVGPVEVSLETMGDELIARMTAAEIYRAVLHALSR